MKEFFLNCWTKYKKELLVGGIVLILLLAAFAKGCSVGMGI